MAKLPDIRRLLREDLKEAPDWVEKLISPINSFAEAIYNALNKQLTFTENFRAIVRTVEFTTPSNYPSSFDQIQLPSGLATKLEGVIVLQLTKKDNPYDPITTSPFVNWLDINGQLTINHVSGLAANTNYVCRILIF